MIDTHAHIYFESFDQGRDEVIVECRQKLDRLVNVGVDVKSSEQCVQLASRSEFQFAVVGFHPEEATVYEQLGGTLDPVLVELEQLIVANKKVVAVGEIGLDYHPQTIVVDPDLQKRWFEAQIKLAQRHSLPVVIHSRDAFDDTLAIIKKYTTQYNTLGVWHSFTENRYRLNQVLDVGLFVGVNGILTFPSAHELRDAIGTMPRDRLVLETDAPLLAPQAHRGERNTPVMVEYVARMVADLWGLSFDEVVRITDENAYNLFSRMR